MAMEWTKSETLALASLRCPQCCGLGLVRGPLGVNAPCQCVLQKIFRVVWNRYKFARLDQRGTPIHNVSGLSKGARRQPGKYAYLLEEFIADFELIAARTLTEDEFRMFKRLDSLSTYTRNKLEAKLGRAFRETEPFALFPLDAYFSRPAPGTRTPALPGKVPARYQPLVPPLAQRQPLKRAA